MKPLATETALSLPPVIPSQVNVPPYRVHRRLGGRVRRDVAGETVRTPTAAAALGTGEGIVAHEADTKDSVIGGEER
jgi:hypothetical protein